MYTFISEYGYVYIIFTYNLYKFILYNVVYNLYKFKFKLLYMFSSITIQNGYVSPVLSWVTIVFVNSN